MYRVGRYQMIIQILYCRPHVLPTKLFCICKMILKWPSYYKKLSNYLWERSLSLWWFCTHFSILCRYETKLQRRRNSKQTKYYFRAEFDGWGSHLSMHVKQSLTRWLTKPSKGNFDFRTKTICKCLWLRGKALVSWQDTKAAKFPSIQPLSDLLQDHCLGILFVPNDFHILDNRFLSQWIICTELKGRESGVDFLHRMIFWTQRTLTSSLLPKLDLVVIEYMSIWARIWQVQLALKLAFDHCRLQLFRALNQSCF